MRPPVFSPPPCQSTSPSSFKLIVLALQFDSSQPNLFAVWVCLESKGKNGPRSRDISLHHTR